MDRRDDHRNGLPVARPWDGRLYQAIGLYDIPIIVGSTIIYAYLLAMTVFILDFIYALVDPRVKVGGG